VLPEFQKQGIGSYIIDTLESDTLFLKAKRVEIPASITAVEFYRKKGYDLMIYWSIPKERLILY
jgi:GNAT superfamily N-acetyltransferase